MWEIKTTDRFDEWYKTLDDTDRENVLAAILVLKAKVIQFGHSLRLIQPELALFSAPEKRPVKRRGFMKR